VASSDDRPRNTRYVTGDDLHNAQAKLRRVGRNVSRVRRQRERTDLWKVVSAEREALETLKNRPTLDSLSASWEVLDHFYDGLIERADEQHVASTPFQALFFYIEMGFYPPPELLLALSAMWDKYLNAAGSVSLEEAFLGRPVKKGGNHAKRWYTRAKYIHMGVMLEALEDEGHSTIKAAELVSERFGGKPEPESVVRLVNAHDPLRKFRKRKNKERS
jgi:hypothetical protein